MLSREEEGDQQAHDLVVVVGGAVLILHVHKHLQEEGHKNKKTHNTWYCKSRGKAKRVARQRERAT